MSNGSNADAGNEDNSEDEDNDVGADANANNGEDTSEGATNEQWSEYQMAWFEAVKKEIKESTKLKGRGKRAQYEGGMPHPR